MMRAALGFALFGGLILTPAVVGIAQFGYGWTVLIPGAVLVAMGAAGVCMLRFGREPTVDWERASTDVVVYRLRRGEEPSDVSAKRFSGVGRLRMYRGRTDAGFLRCFVLGFETPREIVPVAVFRRREEAERMSEELLRDVAPEGVEDREIEVYGNVRLWGKRCEGEASPR